MDEFIAKRMERDLQGQVLGGWTIAERVGTGKSALVIRARRGSDEGAIKIFDLFGRPQTDISIEELDIFLRERPDDPPEFTTSSPNQLSVELDAGVWSVVNWSRGRPRRQDEHRDDRGGEIRF